MRRTQMALFSDDRARARRTDPETSHEAAKTVGASKIRESQMLILRALKMYGPLTDGEILAGFPVGMISPSGARTRRKELVDLGFVEDSGLRRTTSSGRKSIVWKVRYD